MGVFIRRRGGFLQLSADGSTPLSSEIRRPIEQMLTYIYVEHVRGPRAIYNPITGERIRVRTEPRALFVYDGAGLLVCRKGYLPRLRQWLREQQIETQEECLDPSPAADAYTEDWERVVREFRFRPTQDDCLVQIASHDCGIIHAVTAFGKMWVIAMICCLYPKARIDITTKSTNVAGKMQKLLTKYIPNVGLVGDNRSLRGRVTIYTADSLHRSDGQADILLGDEIHELVTDRYVERLARYTRARTFGFSASIDTRGDNLHERLEGLWGPVIFFIDYQTAQAHGLVAPIQVRWLPVNMDVNPVAGIDDDVERKRIGIWRNEYRNSVIARGLAPFMADEQQILVAVETVEHACFLRRQLPNFELCYNEQSMDQAQLEYYINLGFLPQGEQLMTPQRRAWMREAFEDRRLLRVIATSVWSVGVSFDSLQVQVRAEGSRSETKSVQVPGRVCRVSAGKDYGVVLDCMDNFDQGFRNAWLERRRIYSGNGWDQLDEHGQPLKLDTERQGRRRHAL